MARWYLTPILFQLLGSCEREEVGVSFPWKEAHQDTLYFEVRGMGNRSSSNSGAIRIKDPLPGAEVTSFLLKPAIV